VKIKTKRKLSTTIAFIALVIFSLISMVPFLWMISTSLKPTLKDVYTFPPQWIPSPIAWSNYLEAWNSVPFDRFMLNSVITSVIPVFFQVVNGCLSAYVFSQINFKYRDLLFTLFLAVLMVPSQVTIIPNYIILSRLGWLNTYQALMIPFMATAFGTFLIRQSFLAIPRDLIDAAAIDGANHLGILRHIMIPLSKPMIITFALLNFNWRWNDYFWVNIMTTSETMKTLPVGIISMRSGEGGTNWHYLMAGAVIVIIPVMILFLFAQKYFVEGVTHTGIKG
jgi:ABC-type glycerol-3-phosphate transport system permease component